MKSKLISGIFFTVMIAMSSCKAKKELLAAQEHIQKLQTDSTTCNTNLTNTTNSCNANIADLNNRIASLSSQMASCSKDATAYRDLIKDLKARQEMLNAALAEQGTSLKEIREKIISGLSALADSGIDVSFRNGFLYVSLPEDLLFAPGSATLGKKFKAALSPLASVLNNYPRVQIYVVGNTDSYQNS